MTEVRAMGWKFPGWEGSAHLGLRLISAENQDGGTVGFESGIFVNKVPIMK